MSSDDIDSVSGPLPETASVTPASDDDAVDAVLDEGVAIAAGADGGPDDAGSDEAGDDAAEDSAALASAARVNRILLVTVVAVGVILLAGIGFVLWKFVTPPAAPRSQAEQDLFNARSAVEQKPNDANARVEYGSALYRTGDVDGAKRELETALKLLKDYPPALYNLAIIRWYNGEKDQAIKDLRTLVKVNPQDQEAWFRLGAFYEERKDWKNASDAFQRAVELSPGDVAAHVRLGRALERLGQKDEAVAQYQAALQYVPDYKPALEALAALGK